MSDNSGGDGDSFTETSSESWFGRLKGALIGLFFGILLIPGAIWLIAWNEGRAVDTARALAEGSGAVVDVSPDRVDPANQGRLVHIMGPLKVPGRLFDAEYGANAPGAAQLIRQVEMFQWQQSENSETRNKLGGGTETVTTYRYTKTFLDHPIDSTKFRQPNGHANPPFNVRPRTEIAPQGLIGAYRLDRTLLGMLGPREPFQLQAPPPSGTLLDGGVYVGADPQNPALGDLRIRYFVVQPAEASVIGMQDGTGFRPYTTRNGRTLLMVDAGQVSAPAMFNEAKHENTVIAWVLRAVGAVVMLVGFYLLLRPLAVFADLLPILGDIVAAGAGLIALTLTAIVAPVVVAIAWLAVRPLVGVGVLVGGAVVAVLAIRQIRARKAARTPSSFFLRQVP